MDLKLHKRTTTKFHTHYNFSVTLATWLEAVLISARESLRLGLDDLLVVMVRELLNSRLPRSLHRMLKN